MHLHHDGQGPQYLQLSRAIRHAVQQGRIAGGTRLPATRELAQTLGVARNTVRAAYEHLSTVGLLHGRTGAGSFIAECHDCVCRRPAPELSGSLMYILVDRPKFIDVGNIERGPRYL